MPELAATRDLERNLFSWVLGCGMVYAALFGAGWLILGPRPLGAMLLVISAVCAFLLYQVVSRGGWGSAIETEPVGPAEKAHLPNQ